MDHIIIFVLGVVFGFAACVLGEMMNDE